MLRDKKLSVREEVKMERKKIDIKGLWLIGRREIPMVAVTVDQEARESLKVSWWGDLESEF